MKWSKFQPCRQIRWGCFIFCSFIDPFVGASPVHGNSFVPAIYKGTAYVLQTKE